jgi:diguanylate cyclase
MLNVTAQELESILETLDNAVAMHDAWREKLQRTVACKLPPQQADMADDAHRRCAFGKWFYSGGNAHLQQLPSFQGIGILHEAMHGRARELCARIKGHWAITPKEYDSCIEYIARFRGELLGFRQKVYETLHRIDALTGAYSSMHLLPDLSREQQTRKTTGQPYSLLLLGFDLAAINRALGRTAGDELLRKSFAEIRQVLEAGDKIYRYTGAEFVICLPGKDAAHANGLKERMLSVVDQALHAVADRSSATLELHHGVIDLEPDIFIEQLINQAERATYTINL